MKLPAYNDKGEKRLSTNEELSLYSYVSENAELVADEVTDMVRMGIKSAEGGLIFLYGPVYSGKTLAACLVADRLDTLNIEMAAIQPEIGRADVPTDKYFSRSGIERKVKSVKSRKELSRIFDRNDVVIIDEIQFFPSELQSYMLKLIQDYVDRGGWVVSLGMLYTSQASEFLLSAVLKDRSLKNYSLTSTCLKCGRRGAKLNQRTLGGLPTTLEDPELIAPSNMVVYEPRCDSCHVIIG
jgi:thymidine kinase